MATGPVNPGFTSAAASKWGLRAAWVLGGLLLFWGLVYALVPGIAKSQIEKIASAKLGRAVSVGSVDFKPWSLELNVNDLAIARSNSATPQLSIKRIYIDAELRSLLRLAPVVDAVAVDTPVVSLTHLGAGRYDIDDVLDNLKAPPDVAPRLLVVLTPLCKPHRLPRPAKLMQPSNSVTLTWHPIWVSCRPACRTS